MDAVLHCNDLKCRTTLNASAVVTTCSHVFCLPCAERLELSLPNVTQRKCPACGTYLPNPDDASIASLNPTEDYKTSILSGLSPTTIMECAGRGLNFWTYQMAQEITYQEYLARTLKSRHDELKAHLDSVVREANEENTKLHGKLEVMHAEHTGLLERNQNLENRIRQKDRHHRHIDDLYQRLKRQYMAAGMELAVEHYAESVLQGTGSGGPQRASQQQGGMSRRSRSNGSGNGEERRRMTLGPNATYNNSQQHMPHGSRMGLGTSQSASVPSQTTNRQRLPQPTFGTYNSSLLGKPPGTGLDALQKGSPTNSYSYGGQERVPTQAGVGGLNAGMRVSRQPPGYVPQSRGAFAGGDRISNFNPIAMR